jgi:lactate permease
MYTQPTDPLAGSVGLSAAVAVLPLLVLLLMLGLSGTRSHWATIAGLATALVVAIAIYGMPATQALDAAAEGVAFGLFPVMWVVINALWIFRMTEQTGEFDVLRRSFAAITGDPRLQAVIIAFSFGALLEAVAGFGAPVAISSAVLLALGFPPVKAAAIALVANTAPVPFGAVGIPVVTLSAVTGLPEQDLASMIGRQTPFIAIIVPLIVVYIVDGRRGLRETWLGALVAGFAFAVGQFVCSNFISIALTDIVASLVSLAAIVAFLSVRQRARVRAGTTSYGRAPVATRDAPEREMSHVNDAQTGWSGTIRAFAPYAIIVAVLGLAQWQPLRGFLTARTTTFSWPGLNVLGPNGEPPTSQTFTIDWLASAGTLLLFAGLLTMAALRIRPRTAFAAYGAVLGRLKWTILTVTTVLALAYVMNLSGQTTTLGSWIAGASGALPLLAPVIGWLGVSITGSDTASNALFGGLLASAATDAHLSPVLLAAANSSGGVLGKMFSPQHLAIAAAAVGLIGGERRVFRSVMKWSLSLLVVLCALVWLQSTSLLDRMVP